MRTPQLLGTLLLALASFSAASPDPIITPAPTLPNELSRRSPQTAVPTAGVGGGIFGEAEEEATTQKDDEAPDTKTEKPTGSATGSAKDSKETGTNTAKDDKDDKKTGTATKSLKIPATAQAGTVVMVSPNVYQKPEYYRIGATITWVWNYTNVIAKPTAIDIQARAELGKNTYDIAMNQSADTTKAVWDTGEYQKNALTKLPEATYTLIIKEAGKEPNYVAGPGYLSTYQNTRFGLYNSEKYVPYDEWVCVKCPKNDAAGGLGEPIVIRIMIAMGLVTAFSFSWFLRVLA